MASIDWKKIETDTVTLARTLLQGYTTQAKKDLRDFRQRADQQMKTWMTDLANGDITQKNFESLVRGERDLLEMTALKQAGVAQIALDTFGNGVMQIVLNATLSAIP